MEKGSEQKCNRRIQTDPDSQRPVMYQLVRKKMQKNKHCSGLGQEMKFLLVLVAKCFVGS